MSKKDSQEMRYERAIADYYRSVPNCKVTHDARVADYNGDLRQVDVLLEITVPPDFLVKIGVEAKLYSRKLDYKDYGAIESMFKSIGVDKGVIYCPHGAQRGPLRASENSKNPQIEIRQMTLEQIVEASWGPDDFLDQVGRIATAKANTDPDATLQTRIVDLIETLHLHARYFFYKLDNPAWLPILSSRGVLERACLGKNAIPPLTALEYVCRYADGYPEEFLTFSASVQSSFHWIESDLIRASLRLPDEHRKRFLEIASTWAYEDFIDDKSLVRLITDQVNLGNTIGALGLLSRVTRINAKSSDVGDLGSMVRLDSPVRDYHFKELTRELLPDLVEADTEGIVEYARERLSEALRLERPDRPSDLPSWAVRNLSKEGQFGPMGLLETLVYTYRDVLQKLGEIDSSKLADVVSNDLGEQANGAFLRCGICAIANCPGVRANFLKVVLGHPHIWRKVDYIPELEYLVRQSWTELSVETQEAVTLRAMTLERFDYRSTNISPEEAEKYRKDDVINWLLLLKDLGFPPRTEDEATEMLAAYSEATGTTKRVEHDGVKGGLIDPTPKDARAFPEKSVGDILGYCETFEASYGFLEQQTPDGVARELQKEVAKRLEAFLAFADRIVSLPHPAYHSAVADGLTDAFRAKMSVNRTAAADLLGRIVREAKYRDVGDGRRDQMDFGDPTWVRSSVARFLDEATQNDPDPLASQQSLFDLWQELWPSANRESTISGDVDSLTQVINSEAGHLSFALCRLAVRMGTVRKAEGTSEEEKTLAEKWLWDLLSLVDSELLNATEPVVRAPLGFMFTAFFLTERDWTTERTDRFFDKSDTALWEAAWSCHFWMTQRYVPVFEHLRPNYDHALTLFQGADAERCKWAERMGDDFAIFWMSGALEAEDPLLKRFWEVATAQLKSSATLWINAHLTREKWDDIWPKALGWWQQAYERGKQTGQEEGQSVFLHWLDGAPESMRLAEIEPLLIWTIDGERHYLGEKVFEFLSARSAKEANACSRVIEAISKNTNLRLGITDDDRLARLMRQVQATGSKEAIERLINAQRNLLSAGLFVYEDVFEKQESED